MTGTVSTPPGAGQPHGSVAEAAAAVGGIEKELFFEGTATQFRLTDRRPDDYPTDGRWAVEPRDTAEFRSRMVIVRPGDAAQFNGTVLVSWNNVAGESFVTGPAAVRLLRAGFALVGVTAQRSGIEGAAGSSALPDDTDVDVSIPSWGGLRGEDPERYGSLVHPGDAFSFDIFTHAAELIGRSRPTESDPLDGLDVQHLIAMGGSQSASRLATYVNAVQPLGRTFDAFLLQIYAGVPCALDPGSAPPTLPEFGVNTVELLPWRTHHIREDLDVPVIVLNSEFEAEKCHPNHQPDTALVRWWEVAGTAHLGLMGAAEAEGLAAVMPDVCLVSFAPANFAAISALQRWLSGGGSPPHQPRLDKVGDPPALPRDEHGNATGGIRWPEVVAPVGTHVGESPPGFVQLLGHSTPFSDDVIRARYGDRATWLRLYTEAVERLVESQVVLPEDAAEMLARASSRPLPL